MRGTQAYKKVLATFVSYTRQWEFCKIAQKSAVSINSPAKTFLED